MTEHRRTPIKTRSPRQEIWRDRFKKQCESRIKDARSTQIHQRRENQASLGWLQQIIVQEWERFRRENEAALRLETNDLESAIEENLLEELQESYDPSWDEFMQLEEDAMAEAFEDYQQQKSMPQTSSGNRIASDVSEEPREQLCFGCNKNVLQASLSNGIPIWQCSKCQLSANEECMQLLQHHSSICSGHILYSQNSPGDTFILCSDCELCAAL